MWGHTASVCVRARMYECTIARSSSRSATMTEDGPRLFFPFTSTTVHSLYDARCRTPYTTMDAWRSTLGWRSRHQSNLAPSLFSGAPRSSVRIYYITRRLARLSQSRLHERPFWYVEPLALTRRVKQCGPQHRRTNKQTLQTWHHRKNKSIHRPWSMRKRLLYGREYAL